MHTQGEIITAKSVAYFLGCPLFMYILLTKDILSFTPSIVVLWVGWAERKEQSAIIVVIAKL